jgi:endoglucanase
VGDFATGTYNGKYPNGKYMSEGTHWAWLGESQGSGRIDFANGAASYFSLLTSVGSTPVYLEAYDASGKLLATAGPASYNIETGHMTELKITRASRDMAYVIVHDTGNFFLVDSLCTDAPGVHEPAQTEFNCPATAPVVVKPTTSSAPQPLGSYEPESAATRVGGQPWGPLHTNGNQIVNQAGRPIRLAAVNWYGAESADFVPMGLDRRPVQQIANEIAAMGFNAVRLPWSNELVECNPIVPEELVADNPQFSGQSAMTVFDGVVNALAKAGLMVILDNHLTDAGWCCNEPEGKYPDNNDLWWSSQEMRSDSDFATGQAHWTEDWETMAQRYATQPAVIGLDLRNEPRGAAYWGGTTGPTHGGVPTGEAVDSSHLPPNSLKTCPVVDPVACDWRWAAQQEGNAIQAQHPERFLIFVEGTSLATDLTGAYKSPVVLNDPTELVYSPHVYSFSGYCNANSHSQCPPGSQWQGGSPPGSPPPFGFLKHWQDLGRALDSQWGFLAESGDQNHIVTPLWLGEFGTNSWTPSASLVKIVPPDEQNRWFIELTGYLRQRRPISWSYWAVNGTKADSGPIIELEKPRYFQELEEYGILNLAWNVPAFSRGTNPSLLSYLAQIQH